MTDIIKCGHYGAVIKKHGPIRHTFACIEKSNGTEQWFDCFGGHSKTKGIYPAHFAKKKANRPLKMVKTTQAKADLNWSRAIAGMGSTSEKKIRESKAGLVYLLTGVCHQACNSVMFPSKPGGYKYGYINSGMVMTLDTYYAYGYYGGGAWGWGDKNRMKTFRKFKVKRSSRYTVESEPSLDYSTGLVQERLNMKFDRDAVLESMIGRFSIDKNDQRLPSALDKLEKTHKKRMEIERELLLGNFRSESEVSNLLNDLLIQESKVSNSFFSDPIFAESLEEDGDSNLGNVINPELIEFAEINEIGDDVKF